MKRKALLAVVFLAAVSMISAFATAGFAFPDATTPCTNCHPTGAPNPVLTLVSNDGTTAMYNVSTSGITWAVFDGTTPILTDQSGTSFSVPVGPTYTIFAVPATVVAGTPPDLGLTVFTPGPAVTTFTLTYTAGTGGTVVGSSPQVVVSGASGTPVTATPNTGFHFVSWSDGVTTATRTDANVIANVTVSATFAINPVTTFTLTYTAGTGGTIVGSSPQVVASGASGTAVTATPNTGFHFVSWSDGVTTATRTDANVTANITANATFAVNPVGTFTLTYTAGTGGTIVGSSPQVVASGASGTAVTATPNTGFHFVSWSDGVTTATRTDANVTANITASATFAVNPVGTFTLAYTAGAGGSIVGSSTQVVASGASGTPVTATPNTGFHFVSWSDGVTTATRTDTNVTANITANATFAVNVDVQTLTTLSLHSTATRTRVGKLITLSSVLAPVAAGAQIRYEVMRPGSKVWVLIQTRTVDASGASHASRYKLTKRGTYHFRVRFLGSDAFRQSHSPTVNVAVS